MDANHHHRQQQQQQQPRPDLLPAINLRIFLPLLGMQDPEVLQQLASPDFMARPDRKTYCKVLRFLLSLLLPQDEVEGDFRECHPVIMDDKAQISRFIQVAYNKYKLIQEEFPDELPAVTYGLFAMPCGRRFVEFLNCFARFTVVHYLHWANNNYVDENEVDGDNDDGGGGPFVPFVDALPGLASSAAEQDLAAEPEAARLRADDLATLSSLNLEFAGRSLERSLARQERAKSAMDLLACKASELEELERRLREDMDKHLGEARSLLGSDHGAGDLREALGGHCLARLESLNGRRQELDQVLGEMEAWADEVINVLDGSHRSATLDLSGCLQGGFLSQQLERRPVHEVFEKVMQTVRVTGGSQPSRTEKDDDLREVSLEGLESAASFAELFLDRFRKMRTKLGNDLLPKSEAAVERLKDQLIDVNWGSSLAEAFGPDAAALVRLAQPDPWTVKMVHPTKVLHHHHHDGQEIGERQPRYSSLNPPFLMSGLLFESEGCCDEEPTATLSGRIIDDPRSGTGKNEWLRGDDSTPATAFQSAEVSKVSSGIFSPLVSSGCRLPEFSKTGAGRGTAAEQRRVVATPATETRRPPCPPRLTEEEASTTTVPGSAVDEEEAASLLSSPCILPEDQLLLLPKTPMIFRTDRTGSHTPEGGGLVGLPDHLPEETLESPTPAKNGLLPIAGRARFTLSPPGGDQDPEDGATSSRPKLFFALSPSVTLPDLCMTAGPEAATEVNGSCMDVSGLLLHFDQDLDDDRGANPEKPAVVVDSLSRPKDTAHKRSKRISELIRTLGGPGGDPADEDSKDVLLDADLLG